MFLRKNEAQRDGRNNIICQTIQYRRDVKPTKTDNPTCYVSWFSAPIFRVRAKARYHQERVTSGLCGAWNSIISNWELSIIDACNRFMEPIHHKNRFIYRFCLFKECGGRHQRQMNELSWLNEQIDGWMDGWCMEWMLLCCRSSLCCDVFSSLIGLLLAYKFMVIVDGFRTHSLHLVWIMLFRWLYMATVVNRRLLSFCSWPISVLSFIRFRFESCALCSIYLSWVGGRDFGKTRVNRNAVSNRFPLGDFCKLQTALNDVI